MPEIREAVRVGEIDGPGALTEIGDVVVFGSELFVAQPREGLIRRFSTSGDLVGVMGTKGQGPGEFGDIHEVVLVDSVLRVLDRANQRITDMGLGGGVVKTRMIPYPQDRYPIIFRGFAYPTASAAVVIAATTPVHETSPPTLPYVLADGKGNVVDTVGWYRTCRATVCIRDPERGGGIVFSRPLHNEPLFDMAQDGRFFVEVGGDGAEMWVRWFDVENLQADSLSLPPAAVPVPEQLRDSLTRQIRAALGDQARQRMSGREVARLLELPEEVTSPTALFVAAGGEVWLREPDFSSGSVDTWTVVDREARTWRRVRMPSVHRLVGKGGGHVWGVVSDDYGVEYLVGMRLGG
jgi:hypothetical protein